MHVTPYITKKTQINRNQPLAHISKCIISATINFDNDNVTLALIHLPHTRSPLISSAKPLPYGPAVMLVLLGVGVLAAPAAASTAAPRSHCRL